VIDALLCNTVDYTAAANEVNRNCPGNDSRTTQLNNSTQIQRKAALQSLYKSPIFKETVSSILK